MNIHGMGTKKCTDQGASTYSIKYDMDSIPSCRDIMFRYMEHWSCTICSYIGTLLLSGTHDILL